MALTLGGRATPESEFSVDVVAAAPLPSGGRFATQQSEVEIDKLTLRPGAESGWHAHDGPVMVFVAKGTLTNYVVRGRGCVRSRLTPGQMLLESAEEAHQARNESTDDVVFSAVNNYARGGTGAIDAKRPPDCAV